MRGRIKGRKEHTLAYLRLARNNVILKLQVDAFPPPPQPPLSFLVHFGELWKMNRRDKKVLCPAGIQNCESTDSIQRHCHSLTKNFVHVDG